jgi:hypothetical protein
MSFAQSFLETLEHEVRVKIKKEARTEGKKFMDDPD